MPLAAAIVLQATPAEMGFLAALETLPIREAILFSFAAMLSGALPLLLPPLRSMREPPPPWQVGQAVERAVEQPVEQAEAWAEA